MSKKLLHIGRAPDNDIILDELSVSKKHIQLSQEEDNTIYVRDVGSSNGTFINKKKIPLYEKTALKTKDKLTLGNVLFPWEKCFAEEKKEEAPPAIAQEMASAPQDKQKTPQEEPNKEGTEQSAPLPKETAQNLKNSIIKHHKKMSLIEEYGIYALLFVTFVSVMLWYFTNVVKP